MIKPNPLQGKRNGSENVQPLYAKPRKHDMDTKTHTHAHRQSAQSQPRPLRARATRSAVIATVARVAATPMRNFQDGRSSISPNAPDCASFSRICCSYTPRPAFCARLRLLRLLSGAVAFSSCSLSFAAFARLSSLFRAPALLPRRCGWSTAGVAAASYAA